MTGGSTARLVDGLARDLRPVRRLPRLRSVACALVGLWGAVAGLVLWGTGARGDLPGLLLVDPLYAAVLAGLLTAAIGGSLAALASGVPGRQRAVRVGGAVALGGLAVALGACVAGLVAEHAAPGWPTATDRTCFRHATLFGLAPAVALLAFALRGWVERPLRAALATVVGGSAVGAAILHLVCPAPVAPAHLLLGHVLVPVALGLAGALPLGAALRRWAR